MSDPRGVAVVTGAAGTIGRAICEALEPSLTVVGLDRTPGEGVRAVDVTDRAALTEVAADICREVGVPTVVINNAGALTMGRFLDLTDADWHSVFSVNAFGTFLSSQVFARHMVGNGPGRIVNISSVAGKVPLPDQAHYCASKSAIMMLSRCIALELADSQIAAYSVCPGAVDTALFRDCLDWTAERDGRPAEELLAEWLAPSRLGRFVLPEEVAQVVRFLALGPSEALTGHAISVDGGVAPW
jgi:meso-butanediol dehydrogenase/(S,S)-butanediol dehydrogenase/diacetyl reductase